MTPQELKNSILQLAIQGRLVEQRPEEGTAEELYAQIQKEKQALIKAGKIKKEKPLPEISEDEKPFDIPESWMWCRIGEISESNIGLTYKPSDIVDNGGTLVLRSSNIQNNRMAYFDNVFVSCPIPESSQIEKGDLLICARNGSRLLVGKCAIVDQDGCAFGAFMAKIKSPFVPYIKCFLDSPVFRRQLDGVKTETINQITQSNLKNQIIPLPPLAEQKRIVAKIEELLPLIDRYETAWTKLDAFNTRFPGDMQKSLLQMAIQGKLVPQRPEEGTGEELYAQIQAEKQSLIKSGKIKKGKPLPEITDGEKPFDIPDSWKWVRFSEIMNEMSTGPFGSMLHKSDYIDNGIPLVNPANIVNGKIMPSGKMMVSEDTRERLSSYVLHTGMIVLGRRGEMGRCAIVTETEDGWLCGTGSFFMNPCSVLFAEYIGLLFSTPYVKNFLGGESVGTTMSNLNHTILSKTPVPLPPLAEQKRIVAKLEELLPLCERLK